MIKTHASLFSGIGAAEIAADWMGWSNIFHCEIQEFPRRVLEYWYPKSTSYEDITKTDFTPWRGKIDILTGGFPCQSFSMAGKRLGDKDHRYLWPEMLRAIREIQPSWVVGENVTGLLSMVQSGEEVKVGRTDDLFEENYVYRKEQRFTLDEICEGLEREGYAVQPFVVPACAVGAPHRRDRVWIVARIAADTLRTGRQELDAAAEPREALLADSEGDAGGLTPHTVGEGLYEWPTCERENQDAPLGRDVLGAAVGLGGERPASHAESQQGERPGLEQRGPCLSEQGELGGGGREDCYEQPSDRWRDFPTQSPVCSRNDELSARLAGITFPRWRAEAIKALGNAWCIPVAYEIFRAIAQVDNETENNNEYETTHTTTG